MGRAINYLAYTVTRTKDELLIRTHSPTLGNKTANINVKTYQFKTNRKDSVMIFSPMKQQKSFGNRIGVATGYAWAACKDAHALSLCIPPSRVIRVTQKIFAVLIV